jgi:hypothetical protein
MYINTLDNIEFNFNDYELGVERIIRAYWELQMLRFHIVTDELDSSLVHEMNRINKSLGITVISINLNDSYIESDEINKAIEQNEYPKWIWFYGIDALKDTQFSGWLRSRLTVRAIENIRVVFVADSKEDLSKVFGDIKKPLYHSTMPLDINFSVST